MLFDLSSAPIHHFAPSQYFPPASGLAGCVRVILARNTTGWDLNDASRHNYLPTLVTCCLTWVVHGEIKIKTKGHHRTVTKMLFSGPQTQPATTFNVGEVHLFGVMIYPDAFYRMTGVYPGELVNQTVPMQKVLSKEWMDWAQAVALAGNDSTRHAYINDFLLNKWIMCKGPLLKIGPSFSDWIQFLEKHIALKYSDHSQRQVERLVKRWTGQNMRSLQNVARAEQAFFYAFHGLLRGNLSWREVALQSGYSDQSHLCRETRKFSGFSPDELKNGMLNKEAFWIYRLWINAF